MGAHGMGKLEFSPLWAGFGPSVLVLGLSLDLNLKPSNICAELGLSDRKRGA